MKNPILYSSKIYQKIKLAFNAVLNIWFAEYKLIFKDIGVITMFVVVIIVYPFAYPLPFYKGHDVVKELPISVIDNDKTVLSRKFIRMANANENINVSIYSNSLEEAKKEFLENRVNGIVIIPKGFSKDISSNRQTSVSVYCDASYFYIYKQVLTGINYVAGYMSAGIQVEKFQTKGMPYQAAFAAREPVGLISYPLFNPGNSYVDYLIPAVLILILQQTLLIGIGILGGLAYEKNRYKQSLPIVSQDGGVFTIILGKTGAYMSFFLAHSFYFFAVIFRFHELPMKSDIFTLMVFITPFLLSVIFLAMSLATAFKSREKALFILLCTSIPFIFISGFSWPLIAMPVWLGKLAMLIPSTMGIDGFLKISILGASLKDVMSNWVHLWVLAIVYFFIASFVLKTITKKSINYEDVITHDTL